MKTKGFSNSLIDETSPYLLQHAHNPVHWYAWNKLAFEKAKNEDKLVLISIGYSACHWCHVMEHECFEDLEVAEIMNKHFVCIKVDREERPDVDQVYMNAVQLMTQRGGWPLNCFTLPDGRPIYGGTYFPKNHWINVLNSLQDTFENDREKVLEYATKLTQGVRLSEHPILDIEKVPNESILNNAVKKWKQDFDSINGGPNRFPKFPLPKNYEFLLSYGIMFNDQEVISHVQLSLSKMMMGGIYDQIGGGFCRYSVDEIWKVPHFEKMLYDNAQLISLYAKGYRYFNNREYKTIVEEIISFCIRELYSKSKLFYAALDADSEGEEGKFYVWKEEELAQILKQEFSLIKKFYCIGNEALWEHDNNILLRNQSISQFARENNITEEELISKLEFAKTTLLSQRSKRVRPSMDDKILLSWNALMIIGMVDAHVSLQNDEYLNLALSATEAILEKNSLHEISKRNFKSKLEREFIFLEDYSLMIEALLKVFEASSNKKYVEIAENYVEFVFENYLDSETNLFYYTSKSQDDLIARKIELQDNVIPSSNSIFANCLHKLYKITGKQKYYEVCTKILSYNLSQTEEYASSYSNWAILLQKVCKPFHEVVIIGKDAKLAFFEFYSQSIPNTYCFFSETENNELEIFKNRFQTNKTLFYLCTNNSCLPPVDNLLELLNQLKN